MKRIAIAILTILALFGVYVGGAAVVEEFRTYRGMKASAAYLFSPQPDVPGKDGTPLTRAQILDAIMADVIARQQAAAPPAQK